MVFPVEDCFFPILVEGAFDAVPLAKHSEEVGPVAGQEVPQIRKLAGKLTDRFGTPWMIVTQQQSAR